MRKKSNFKQVVINQEMINKTKELLNKTMIAISLTYKVTDFSDTTPRDRKMMEARRKITDAIYRYEQTIRELTNELQE